MFKKLFLFFLLSTFIYCQNSVFIKYSDGISLNQIESIKQQHHKKFVGDRPLKRVFATSVADRFNIENSDRLKRIVLYNFVNGAQKEDFLNSLDNTLLEYVQNPGSYKIDYTPNDSLLTEQWALNNINALEAWDITTGSPEIRIAVIDTGIDFFHPDLNDNIYINPGEDLNNNGLYDESDNNGIDDDNNGFVDDIMGWDFTDRFGFPFDSTSGDYTEWDNYPMDDHGHGTYVAGIIGAEQNNISGVSGLAPKCKLVNLRAFDPSGYGDEDDVAAAILYAVKTNADIINMSFGDNSFSYVLRDIIDYAYSQGVILVGSAGNTGSSKPHYPSGYTQVISVGNSTQNDYVYSSSNYGSTIDVVAPGLQIMTTELDGKYTRINGTSASAPFVSATAGLLLSLDTYTNEEVKQIIKTTSDDIGESGWDTLSGAGRLNTFKALEVAAPAKVAIVNPPMDYSTSADKLPISASILSPYFQSFDLKLGVGYVPSSFETLLENQQYQFVNDTIFELSIAQLPDTVYTLSLSVSFLNGRTVEERVNFHIDNTPPTGTLLNSGAAYYGSKPTIIASIYTDEIAIAEFYYSKGGEEDFKFITLDGLTVNNQFAKQFHYGFIPSDLLEYETTYDVYYKIRNLTGLETILNNEGEYFRYKTPEAISSRPTIEKDYTLNNGRIFRDSPNITSKNNLLMNEAPNSQFLHIYEFSGTGLTKLDSIEERIPLSTGDFNNDGKTDILSTFLRRAYIETQTSTGSSSFENVYSDESTEFWPVLAADIDNDGKTEVIAIKNETSILIREVNQDFTLTDEAELQNFSEAGPLANFFTTTRGTICDSDNNGLLEFWIADSDGDVIGYEATGTDSYANKAVISSGLSGFDFRITSGDFDNDGKDDIAVLLRSFEDLHIAPFYVYYIYNFTGTTLNVVDTKTLFDPSVEFSSSIFHTAGNDIKFEDIDNDGRDELILFTFPYAYLAEYENNEFSFTHYREDVNSDYIFTGDLDGNGIADIALPDDYGVSFIEFEAKDIALLPIEFSGFGINNKVTLKWEGDNERTLIYKGTAPDNLQLIDSVSANSYSDLNVQNGTKYYYGLQSYNSAKEIMYSGIGKTIEVYVHSQIEVQNVDIFFAKNIVVTFNGNINKTILNMASFEVQGVGYPSSASVSAENAYLINMAQPLEAGNYTLSVKGIKDFYGAPVKDADVNFVVEPNLGIDEFYINSYQLSGKYGLTIEFNIPAGSSALDKNSYNITPVNSVSSVKFTDETKQKVTIKTRNPIQSIGKEVVISLNNIFSSSETGGLKINDGAGGFIVISTFENNLENVLIYPNPYKFNSFTEKITFANLTKKAKIIIFTLDGKKIIELEENDGNGGVEWDLRNFDGEFVSTGVYLCYIQALDENGNETETKLEKFAVIR